MQKLAGNGSIRQSPKNADWMVCQPRPFRNAGEVNWSQVSSCVICTPAGPTRFRPDSRVFVFINGKLLSKKAKDVRPGDMVFIRKPGVHIPYELIERNLANCPRYIATVPALYADPLGSKVTKFRVLLIDGLIQSGKLTGTDLENKKMRRGIDFSHGEYAHMAHRVIDVLGENGADRSYSAVWKWLYGPTVGPRPLETLKSLAPLNPLLAELADSPEFREQYNTHMTLRRVLARRLENLTASAARKANSHKQAANSGKGGINTDEELALILNQLVVDFNDELALIVVEAVRPAEKEARQPSEVAGMREEGERRLVVGEQDVGEKPKLPAVSMLEIFKTSVLTSEILFEVGYGVLKFQEERVSSVHYKQFTNILFLAGLFQRREFYEKTLSLMKMSPESVDGLIVNFMRTMSSEKIDAMYGLPPGTMAKVLELYQRCSSSIPEEYNDLGILGTRVKMLQTKLAKEGLVMDRHGKKELEHNIKDLEKKFEAKHMTLAKDYGLNLEKDGWLLMVYFRELLKHFEDEGKGERVEKIRTSRAYAERVRASSERDGHVFITREEAERILGENGLLQAMKLIHPHNFNDPMHEISKSSPAQPAQTTQSRRSIIDNVLKHYK